VLIVAVWATPCVAQDHPGGMLGIETPWWPQIRRDCPPAINDKSPEGKPITHTERAEEVETCLIDLLSDDPIHPVLESVAPRSGTAAGLSGGWDFSHGTDQISAAARALVSVNGFWVVDAKYTLAPRIKRGGPTHTIARPRIDFYSRYWDLPSLAYYGLGPASPHIAIPFKFQELITGADASFPAFDWLQLGTRVEFRRPQVEASGVAPTIPGVTVPASFIRYSAIAHLHSPAIPPYTAAATLDYSVYEDVGEGPLSFGQFTTRLIVTHPITHNIRTDSGATRSLIDRVFCHAAKVTACDYGTITFKGQLTLSNTFDHSGIPFYYQPTLGGTDLDGFDTLRGFDDYRFRAPDDWLAQVEYSHVIWGPLGLLLFYDAGKVALGTSQMNFAEVRQDFGVGATLTMVSRMVLRAYIAFGSGESTSTAVKLAQF
jgi:hypothetical protein